MAPDFMPKKSKVVKKHKDGATINLFVTPGAKTILFPAGYNKWRNCIDIKVKAPAKDTQANKEVIKTIADFFNTPIKDVYIISGSKNRLKTILVKGISVNNISEKLLGHLNGL
ncbi:hypothetical protein AYK24_09515 [Thermoplasmatales archaeon SG8-52-4]|nr:MAG: hypothetical protein AYK24_09515 [Thermoplasmatales archaeon SG8-52-4]